MADAEFLAAYGKELRAVRNEKSCINQLTFLAEDAVAQGCAPGLVALLENHVMTCPAPQKITAMYLLDSIVKNVGGPYKALFAQRLPQVFGSVWSSALQDTRAKLLKLLNLWEGHFPTGVLQAAKAHTKAAPSSAAATAPGVAVVRPAGAQQLQQGGPLTYALAGQPTLVAAQPGFQAFAGFPMAVSSAGNGYATFGQPLQLPMGPGAAPMGQLVLSGMPMVGQPMLLQQRIMVAPPQASAGMVAAPAAGAPASPTPVPQWMQQPAPALATQQQPPPPPGRPKRSPSPSMLTSALGVRPAGGQQQGAGSLAQMLGSLAAGGLLTQPVLPSEDPALRITTFDPAFIKEYHPGVVQQLQALSKNVATALKDLEFHRKRRRAAGGAVSRQWYVTSQDWIAGTVISTAAPADAFGGEDEEAAAPAQVFLEPEDPTQPTCAISGEPFDKVYDDKQDDWFYQDAKRIYGPDAERYGVPDGSIVKVKCLAEASGLSAAGGGADEEQDAARLAADMAAAAAEAPDALEAPAAAGSAGLHTSGGNAAAAAAGSPLAGGLTPPGLDVGDPSTAAAEAAAVVKMEPGAVDPPSASPADQQSTAAPAAASMNPDMEDAAGADPATSTPAAALEEALQPAAAPGAGLPLQPLVVPQPPEEGPGEAAAPSSTGSKRASETFSEEVGAASKRLKAAGL